MLWDAPNTVRTARKRIGLSTRGRLRLLKSLPNFVHISSILIPKIGIKWTFLRSYFNLENQLEITTGKLITEKRDYL